MPLDAAPSYGTFSNASIAFEPSTANSLATMVLEVAPTSSLEPGDSLNVWVPGFSFTAPLGGSLDDVAFSSSSSAELRVQYVEGSFGSVQVGALKVADEGYLRRDSDAPETPAGLESMRAKVNEALASSQLYEETPPQILDVRAALYAAPGGGDDQSALRGTSICAGELIPIFVVFDKDVSVYASSRTSPPYALELDVGNGRTVFAPLSTGVHGWSTTKNLGSRYLRFDYVVGEGDYSKDLAPIHTQALVRDPSTADGRDQTSRGRGGRGPGAAGPVLHARRLPDAGQREFEPADPWAAS